MMTDTPERTSTAHMQRARAIGVMREVEVVIPDDMDAHLGITPWYEIRVQLTSDDPDDARELAIALGFTRPETISETDEYVHHTYSGSIDGYTVECLVLTPKPHLQAVLQAVPDPS